MEGCAFAKFGNSSGTEGEPVKKIRKMGKKRQIINAAATGNRTRDPSITDQMSGLTNQVHLKIQFRHRFDKKVSIHRLVSQTRFSLRSKLFCSTRNHCIQPNLFQLQRYVFIFNMELICFRYLQTDTT